MARPIVLIPHLFRLADAINFRKDYSPPSSPPSRPYIAEGPSAPKVDPWKKFEHRKSLYNPEALGELGTQMYLLNNWYMAACERGENFVSVRVRNQQYFRGDDVIYVEFLELHQLCHLDSLDKSLISCYCL